MERRERRMVAERVGVAARFGTGWGDGLSAARSAIGQITLLVLRALQGPSSLEPGA